MATKSKTETGKIRHLAGATAFSMAVLSGSVYGLGLGSIELGSALNQPFSAEIEVITDVPGEAAELAVQLASQEAFLRAGIDRPQSLNKLSFSLRERGGRSFILVSSADPIVEPFLNFLVEVDWKRGNLVREYTVLLDPPTYVNNTPSTTVTSELAQVGDGSATDPTLPTRIERDNSNTDFTSTTLTEEELAAELAAVNLALGATETATAEVAEPADPLLDELREVDDLMVVAGNGQPLVGGNAEPVASAPVASEPVVTEAPAATATSELVEVDDDAVFASSSATSVDTNSASVADTADNEASYTETAVDDVEAVVAALDRELMGDTATPSTESAAPAAAEAAAATGKTLEPVQRGQTLWSIASANRVPGVSVEQMMVALLRANPNAFEDGNINALNRGAIMRVPTADEVADMDSQSALTSVNEQNALWKKYRDQARAKPVEAQQGENATEAPVAKVETETAPADGTLTLVADTEEAKAGEEEQVDANTAISAEAENRLAELRNQLNLAQEEADTERQRADEMNSRVVDLESAVDKMNTLLELRNAELAKLQSAMTEGQSEAEAETARQLAETQAEMAAQLQQVKDDAKDQAEAAEAQRLSAEAEIAKLQAALEAEEAEGDEAAEAAATALAAAEEKATAAAAAAKNAADSAATAIEERAAEAAAAATAAAEEKAAAAVAAAEEKAAEAAAAAEAKVAEAAAVAEAKAEEAAAAAAAAAEAAQNAVTDPVVVEPTDNGELAIPEIDAKDEAWYKPYLTAENAKYAGLGLLGLVGLGLFASRGKKRKEEKLFSEENYEVTDNTAAHATNAYESQEVLDNDETEVGYDATAYGHTAIADELADETVDATDLTALDATLNEAAPEAGNVDILQEADVYLSYGLADRAEELLDGAIAADPNDEMLQAKRLEALFVKQDGVTFETAATKYHDSFGGDEAPHWDKVASWGAALAPSANLFRGAEPANLDETQDITSLDTTKLAGGAAAATAAAGGLAATFGDKAKGALDGAMDMGADLKDSAADGLSLTKTELEDALDNTTEAASGLGADLSDTASDSIESIGDLGGIDGDLGGLGDDLGTDLSADLDSDLSSGLSDDLSADLSADLDSELGSDLSAGLESGLDDLEATAASLGDDLESMSAGLEGDLEMTDLEATLAGDGDLQDMLDATGADDFELSLADEGTGAGDGGLAGEIGLGDLESELLGTDGTGSLGGLSEEIDFEGAGLSLGDETTDADLTVTGDEVDTMLDLARAYIDMGDSDSATSTINEIIATGNADQVEAAKELQSQLG